MSWIHLKLFHFLIQVKCQQVNIHFWILLLANLEFFKCRNFPFSWQISWPVKGWQIYSTKYWIKMPLFLVHFNFTSSNISYRICNIWLPKTFIVKSWEAILNFFSKTGWYMEIKNHYQIKIDFFTWYLRFPLGGKCPNTVSRSVLRWPCQLEMKMCSMEN